MKPVTATWIAVPAIALLTLAAAAGRATASPQTVTEKTVDGAEKAKDAVVKGTTVAADKTKEGLSKTGEVMTDEWITGRVHARFVDEDLLKGSNISVDTHKHVVTLKGTVKTQPGKARAVALAKGVEGVKSVVDQLTVAK